MDNCLFCQIIDGKKSAQIVYQNESVVAVLDVFPRSLGHVIVLPRHHVENILELSANEMGLVFDGVQTVTKLLKDKLSPHGFTIGINHGKVSGQVIDHLHIHIIPRFDGDGGGSIHSIVNSPPKESLEEIKNKIIN
ncbi:MAG TPA: HIT family protein [Candidatus Paceibacterota bacterium]|nr:HIT family protein [Candidatus Paceibacterota bacterium]